MKLSLKFILCLLFVFSDVGAHNKVVVIPLFDNIASIGNVITVSKSGGNFTSLNKALDSIKDSSESKPYLIVLGPGAFRTSTTHKMKRYVSITGSGKAMTTLTGKNVTTRCVLESMHGSIISNLTIEHIDKNGATLVGVCDGGGTLNNIDIIVKGGSRNIGVQSFESLGLELNNVWLEISEPSDQSSMNNAGIDSFLFARFNLNGGGIKVFGNSSAAILSQEVSIFRINNSIIDGSDFALKLVFGGIAIINNSKIVRGNVFVDTVQGTNNNFSSLTIRSSEIDQSVSFTGDGTKRCFSSDNGLLSYDENCQISSP